MLKKLLTLASAALITTAMLTTAQAEGLRRSGQAGWDNYRGMLGLKIGGNASAVFGNEEYCSRNGVRSMILNHYPSNVDVIFVGSMTKLLGRIQGDWGGSGDTDGMVLADVFDCGISLGKRLTGGVCVTLDITQPLGTRYCGYGTQE